jgi:hypothetical protein
MMITRILKKKKSFLKKIQMKKLTLNPFWGYKDNAESEEEDENLEKLKHVETEK